MAIFPGLTVSFKSRKNLFWFMCVTTNAKSMLSPSILSLLVTVLEQIAEIKVHAFNLWILIGNNVE